MCVCTDGVHAWEAANETDNTWDETGMSGCKDIPNPSGLEVCAGGVHACMVQGRSDQARDMCGCASNDNIW